MSRDQRPGKMRVVGEATAPVEAVPAVAGAASGGALAPAGAAPAAAPSGKLPLLGILLFLVGCAAGGAALTALGVFG